MTEKEKKTLYENIMQDIAKVVKQRIVEYADAGITVDDTDGFDIRNYLPGYRKVLNWLEDVNDDLDSSDDALQESLEPEFSVRLRRFINTNLRKYSENATMLAYTTPKVRYVNIQMPEGPMRFIDIIFDAPDKNDFVPALNSFMAKRNYSMVMFTVMTGRLNIVYADNDAVKVNFSDVEDNPEFDGRIYHLTTKETAEEILRSGFELRSRDNEFGITYSPRTYFFTTRRAALHYTDTIEIEHNTKSLALVSIPVDAIADIDFFYDPLTEEFEGIYTETKINDTEHISSEDVTV